MLNVTFRATAGSLLFQGDDLTAVKMSFTEDTIFATETRKLLDCKGLITGIAFALSTVLGG
ncbi:MAG: hypothetical protein C5B54_07025 [Acidobacteria bacterium]|nr:MAG: hypothetical protein C5B54_07025 [Acidobacteriota bacterium]